MKPNELAYIWTIIDLKINSVKPGTCHSLMKAFKSRLNGRHSTKPTDS